jgi:Methyltransferase domain
MAQRGIQKLATILQIRARWMRYSLVDRLSPAPPTIRCPLCEIEERPALFRTLVAKDYFWGGRLVRHQCPGCDVIFGTRRMLSLSPQDLEAEYRDLYSVYDENDSTNLELAAFEHIHPKPGGRYLNFGSGRWSSALSVLRERGYDIVGFEPYSKADSTGQVITREQELRQLRFDGIMSNNLIEHMQDPVAALTMQAVLLKDQESCMVHSTSCYRYELEHSRFHLFFFVGRSVEVLARRAGLRVEETANPDVRRFLKTP